jgi:hypothetical protein
VLEYVRTDMWTTDITQIANEDCGPFVYTIDPVCSQFISVYEDVNTSELVFTYTQPYDVEQRVGFLMVCEMQVSLENYPMVMPQYAFWEVNITASGDTCPDVAEYFVPAATVDAVTNLVITENKVGKEYYMPLA